ncbi:MAG TPA: DUF3224 domain-containing protein [Micromonosporaceae bacterium]|nr:DUF3224 domain-containing protein [Micromonosporaceae bacterium]
MTKIIESKLKIESWDEKPYREFPDGSKFTRAEVVLGGSGEGFESGWFEALMFYRPDGTTTYVTLMQLTGTLDGRSGSFVLQGDGTFDGTTARGESRVVPGSATGDLTSLTGTAVSVSTHADYPHMPLTLEYDFE